MYCLPELPYAENALAPVIGAETVRTHHGKHHARYVNVTNELVAKASGTTPLEDLMLAARKEGNAKLFNNAAQAWNHAFFWECMAAGSGAPAGELATAIESDFGGLAKLRSAFIGEGGGHFGSGWVWLVYRDGKLAVVSTHDAANPQSEGLGTPLLVCDVWEHAYYLDHKNDRNGFLEAWFDKLVNWDFVARQYAAAKEGKAGYRYPAPKQAG
jgi:Fe-Mn family superoxide dismutase